MPSTASKGRAHDRNLQPSKSLKLILAKKEPSTHDSTGQTCLCPQFDDFRDAPLEYPTSFADLYQAKVKDKPEPNPHQIKAIEGATAGLKSSDRGQMIMVCGTGETFTTLWIKEALEAHTTLDRRLLNQLFYKNPCPQFQRPTFLAVWTEWCS